MKIFCAVYLYMLCFGVSCGFSRIARIEVYEGDNCKLKTGANGICKKFNECEPLMNDIVHGRNYDDRVKCTGNENEDIEIVCCPQTISPKNSSTNQANPINSINSAFRSPYKKTGRRPSDRACSEYEDRINGEILSTEFHITKGLRVEEGEFPYMAALAYQSFNANGEKITDYTCGGTLISLKHVLTAAHCVNNFDRRVPYQVRLGSVDLRWASENMQDIRIKNWTVHPSHRRSKKIYDVALLELEEPANWTKYVRPICLQTTHITGLNNGPLAGPYLVIGFGATDIMGPPSEKLLKTPPLTLSSSKDCQRFYPQDDLGNHTFCAMDSNTTRQADACHGDSGGPLLHIELRDTIIGVTAFGRLCGNPIPAGYMAVHSFLDWIEAIVWPQPEN